MNNIVKNICLLCSLIQCIEIQAQTLKVAIASSLIPPFTEIVAQLKTSTNLEVELIPGATGALTHQIINGAPYDILISANEEYCKVIEERKIDKHTYYEVFDGNIILWSKAPLDTTSYSVTEALIGLIQNSKNINIAIANPQIAPYGKVSQAYLDELGIGQLSATIIQGSNISLTNQYISSQSVDLAITALSSYKNLKRHIPQFWYPLSTYKTRVTHCISLLSLNSKTELFISHLRDTDNIRILQSYGYLVNTSKFSE